MNRRDLILDQIEHQVAGIQPIDYCGICRTIN